jgi:hypothetical protein
MGLLTRDYLFGLPLKYSRMRRKTVDCVNGVSDWAGADATLWEPT